ncbi:MAG: 2-succinyl-5-enolpyruvyl-6-hydroxy-3-cyclohexene-1-carboxylic-acid synthase [Trueperella sp.]|nr:2-succinyl-5-enolpyruvyl-6-hydroxy-3-cyclohexene-1-carboxylic-acid synthase [Trueperella sp.]
MTPLDSTAVSRLIVAELVRCGVRTVVLCPGSRSAPLAYALYDTAQAGKITLQVETDERVAGFVALGVGLANPDAPAAVVTTSGSAVANLVPAAQEAYYAGVPLVLVTADRPDQLRGVRASQTTDQRAVLAGSVREFIAVPAPVSEPQKLRGQIFRLLRAARGAENPPGPVQLNVAFAEPLVPSSAWETVAADCARPLPATAPQRTVAVCGPSVGAPVAAEVFANIPVLAEPSAAERNHPNALIAHPLLLRTELRAQIQRVLVVGHPTLTRETIRLISDPQLEVIAVADAAGYTDPGGVVRKVVPASHTAELLTLTAGQDPSWLASWQSSAARAQAKIDELSATEPAIQLAQALATGPAVVASSSIIRQLNLYGLVPSAPLFANRGLAGIDGIISTARGVALASGQRLRVVVGDLAFVHDVGSLIAGAGQSAPELDVVVLDDHGGSIFAGLEYGTAPVAVFDAVFRTEKQISLADYADAVGAAFIATTPAELAAVLAQSATGLRLIAVELGRVAPATEKLRRAQLAEQVTAAVVEN